MKVLLSLVPPPTDEIRHRESHPACWQQSRMLCERHLHSWRDNQHTGVFNLRYVLWTTHHSHHALLFYTAHGQGGIYFSPWQAGTSPLSWTNIPCSKWSEPYWSNVFEVFWGLEASGCQHRFTYWVVETVGEESGIHAEKRLPGSTVRENIK